MRASSSGANSPQGCQSRSSIGKYISGAYTNNAAVHRNSFVSKSHQMPNRSKSK